MPPSPVCPSLSSSPVYSRPDRVYKKVDVPLAGALAVGARARVPDGFVRHDVWLKRVRRVGSLLQSALGLPFLLEDFCASFWHKMNVLVSCSRRNRRSALGLSFTKVTAVFSGAIFVGGAGKP